MMILEKKKKEKIINYVKIMIPIKEQIKILFSFNAPKSNLNDQAQILTHLSYFFFYYSILLYFVFLSNILVIIIF
jgi:hypothetical protein